MDDIEEPLTGYRSVQEDQDVARWRHRLFSHLRDSPLYQRLSKEVANDPSTRESIARQLGLQQDGKPCAWATELIDRDLDGRFWPDRTPVARTTASVRHIELRVRLNRMSVGTWQPDDSPHERLGMYSHRPNTIMQLGKDDWDEFEHMAIMAIRTVVNEMKAASGQGVAMPGIPPRKRIKAGNEQRREIQIERLALRLSGRSGTRNSPKIDRDWCKFLDIDVPSAE